MSVKQVTPEEASRLVDSGHAYVDVRTEREFAAGHPVKALNIPFMVTGPAGGPMVPNPDFLADLQATFARDAALVIGCQSGMRSQRAAEALVQAGYTDVSNMRGGFGGLRDPAGRTVAPGWTDAELPVCRDCGETYAQVKARAGAKG